MNFTAAPVRVLVTCTSCSREITLECEGISGPYGYEIYEEFACPYCRKHNAARTPGHIIAIHAPDRP